MQSLGTHTPSPDVNVNAAGTQASLDEEALEAHDAREVCKVCAVFDDEQDLQTQQLQDDVSFAQIGVRQEATQAFEQQLYHWPNTPDATSVLTGRVEPDCQPRDGDTMASIARLYGFDKPTSSTPMERFGTLVLPNEPLP